MKGGREEGGLVEGGRRWEEGLEGVWGGGLEKEDRKREDKKREDWKMEDRTR